MTKILTVDDMLSAAHQSGMPAAAEFTRAVETLGTALAHSLALHLGIETNYADFQDGFSGTAAPFFPAKPGQECPAVIDSGDEGGDWEDGDHLPATPDDAPQTLGDAVGHLVRMIARK